MDRALSFERFLEILASHGVVDAEHDRERVWRLYLALDLSTAEVQANAIESALLRPERERTHPRHERP
jgi:hypothetical protein